MMKRSKIGEGTASRATVLGKSAVGVAGVRNQIHSDAVEIFKAISVYVEQIMPRIEIFRYVGSDARGVLWGSDARGVPGIGRTERAGDRMQGQCGIFSFYRVFSPQ
jgi:hypothetical protein